jgi:hypothetical protein
MPSQHQEPAAPDQPRKNSKKGDHMDLQPKLLAAADMCEAGEEVNLDELAFLLRYASDELAERPEGLAERDRLRERLRERVLARATLLERSEEELGRIADAQLDELERLDDELERELRHRYAGEGDEATEGAEPSRRAARPELERFRSGR